VSKVIQWGAKMYLNKKVAQYQKASKQYSLLGADPHQVIMILMNAAVDSMAIAKGCIERKDFEGKSNAINKAIQVIGGLQDGLNLDVDNGIGQNLNSLYDYMIRRLTEASLEMSIEKVNEVAQLIIPIRDAWRQIPEADKQKGFQLIDQYNQQKRQQANAS